MSRKAGIVLAAMASVVVGGFAQDADAALIGLDLPSYPDIASSFIDISYDASQDLFKADGFAVEYTQGEADIDTITNGAFSITANIDENGLSGAGTLSIDGTVNFQGPSLLQADLVDFGFIDGGGSLLEFVFEITSGVLAGDFGGVGMRVGVIMNMNSGNYTSFGSSFDNRFLGIPGTGMGTADTKPAPLPAPGAVALLIGTAFVGRRRRRDDR